MKKAGYYLLLYLSFILMLPYIILAILSEFYFRLIIKLIDKPTSYVRNCGVYPEWMSAIFRYIDKLQEYDYED